MGPLERVKGLLMTSTMPRERGSPLSRAALSTDSLVQAMVVNAELPSGSALSMGASTLSLREMDPELLAELSRPESPLVRFGSSTGSVGGLVRGSRAPGGMGFGLYNERDSMNREHATLRTPLSAGQRRGPRGLNQFAPVHTSLGPSHFEADRAARGFVGVG